MKWFHHECAARLDPKLQILGEAHSSEGLGIYWCLLEEIGLHSDTFHFKIDGLSEEADKEFMNLLHEFKYPPEAGPLIDIDPTRIPRIPVKILAKNMFTVTKKLVAVIQTCVETGLFDPFKWIKYNILHSPPFEHRADDYTRRVQRTTRRGRIAFAPAPNDSGTPSGDSPTLLRTISANVPLDTEEEQNENRNRTEKDLLARDARGKTELSTCRDHEQASNESFLLILTADTFREHCTRFRTDLSRWNEGNTNKFDWTPTDAELRKLFLGGSDDHKLRMCHLAYNILAERTTYPELVLRSLRLMLKASKTTRITNPFGWMWTCLHGNGDGTLPWVQLLTSDEEGAMTSLLQRRVRDNHPP